jgi:hypothetical protein
VNAFWHHALVDLAIRLAESHTDIKESMKAKNKIIAEVLKVTHLPGPPTRGSFGKQGKAKEVPAKADHARPGG